MRTHPFWGVGERTGRKHREQKGRGETEKTWKGHVSTTAEIINILTHLIVLGSCLQSAEAGPA
jgi:hypothetical protein